MAGLAVVLGSSATGPGGAEIVAAAQRHADRVVQRHGEAGYTLPHAIDHAANLRPLAEAGCDRVLAICSVGSLDPGLPVGSFVCPHDFIALQVTVTSLDDTRAHAMPGFDRPWRERVLTTLGRRAESGRHSSASGPSAEEVRDGGVYWQTSGPRFETPAEIGLIAAHADLVGMTMASECIVASELGLAYAAICSVDNMANGVAAQPLSPERLLRDRESNVARLAADLDAALPELAS